MFDNGRWLLSNRPPVVLLADKQKAQMDEAVHEMLRCDHPRQTGLPCPIQSTCCHELETGGTHALPARVPLIKHQKNPLARMIAAMRFLYSTGVERASVCRCCVSTPQGPRAAPGGSHSGGQPLQAVRAQEGERRCTRLYTFTVLFWLQYCSDGLLPASYDVLSCSAVTSVSCLHLLCWPPCA
jgi:hypothetical protein